MPATEAQFELEVHSFTPPELPQQPADLDPGTIRSARIPNQLAATTPLTVALRLPSARPQDPLYPATHLQLIYDFAGTGQHFVTDPIRSEDLAPLLVESTSTSTSVGGQVDDEAAAAAEPERPPLLLYVAEVHPAEVARVKVNPGQTSDATVLLDAWRREKRLGRWSVGTIHGLGLVGLKDFALHRRRMEQWKAAREG